MIRSAREIEHSQVNYTATTISEGMNQYCGREDKSWYGSETDNVKWPNAERVSFVGFCIVLSGLEDGDTEDRGPICRAGTGLNNQ
jgi:hypothetical protein